MYKNASRNLQRAHGINGLAGSHEPADALPQVDQMTLEELQSERALLIRQKTQLEIEVNAQKSAGHTRAVKGAGYRIQTLCARLSEVNAQIKARNAAGQQDAIRTAMHAIHAAVRAHQAPGGISAEECCARVIAAVEAQKAA